MSSEQALKDVIEFIKLPDTPEQKEIIRKYLADEIGHLEFYSMALEYLLVTPTTQGRA